MEFLSKQEKTYFTNNFYRMDYKIYAVGQMAELLNNTIKKSYGVGESFSRGEVLENHLFHDEEVQLIKKKFLKILSEI